MQYTVLYIQTQTYKIKDTHNTHYTIHIGTV